MVDTHLRRAGTSRSISDPGTELVAPPPPLDKAKKVIPRVLSRKDTSTMRLFSRFLRVGKAFFQGDAKWKARGLMGLMLVLCGISTGLFVVLSYTQRDFSTALSNKHEAGFYKAIGRFIGGIIVAAPLFAIYDYVQDRLALEWRQWLTELLLSNYFSNRAFFDLKLENQLDNPDQRIVEDVRNYVSGTVSLIVVVASKLLNSVAFAGVLWSVSPELVGFLLAYASFGTYATVRIFGKRLMRLQYEGLQKQADLRYSLVRVRENAESIAFYQGEAREAHNVKGFLTAMVKVLLERVTWNRHLSLFSNFYDYATIVLPSLIIAPRYFRGEVEFGVITQTGFAFNRILSAMAIIVSKFGELSELAAGTERLDALILALARHSGDRSLASSEHLAEFSHHTKSSGQQSSGDNVPLLSVVAEQRAGRKIAREDGKGLSLQSVSIVTPDQRQVLFENLDVRLSPGQSMLVVGPSGCGKSSLLRAIAGLWTSGEGVIACPPREELFFLPQKPYMPLGSLRAQLLFPKDESCPLHSSDPDLLQALQEVHLEMLPSKVGGLDVQCDWSDTLSSGEQQRVAFARLLLQRPQMAFLDEASSALDSANEARLYSLVQQRIACYVSVGHRLALVKYHTHVLEYVEDVGWRFLSRAAFESSRGGPLP